MHQQCQHAASVFSAKRAFVVQVHTDARVEQHDCKGRVGHLVTGEATHFDSLEELITFIVQTLTEQPQFQIPRKVVIKTSRICVLPTTACVIVRQRASRR